jgi:NTP pyrophosphatase (non-canonical NTP hydrolase)
MQLNELAIRHHAWVDLMGWHNKTVLESLGLIGTEIAEAGEEVFVFLDPEHRHESRLGEELADVMLRMMDLSVDEGFDLSEAAEGAGEVSWRSDNLYAQVTEVFADWKNAANAARKKQLDESFVQSVGKLARRVMTLAEMYRLNLLSEIRAKMEVNDVRGTRGRVI